MYFFRRKRIKNSLNNYSSTSDERRHCMAHTACVPLDCQFSLVAKCCRSLHFARIHSGAFLTLQCKVWPLWTFGFCFSEIHDNVVDFWRMSEVPRNCLRKIPWKGVSACASALYLSTVSCGWPNQPLQQTANLNQRACFNSTGIISCFLILCLSRKEGKKKMPPGLGWSGVTPHKQTFSGRVAWPRHTSSERLVLPALGINAGRTTKRYKKHLCTFYTHLCCQMHGMYWGESKDGYRERRAFVTQLPHLLHTLVFTEINSW